MNRLFKKILNSHPYPDLEILSSAHIAHLPEPIQRYLSFSQVLGKPITQSLWLHQKGRFLLKGKRWVAMQAEQLFDIPAQAFIWKAKTGLFRVTDQYLEQSGALIVKMGPFRLAKAIGPEVDQGEALRLLTELIWMPSAFTAPFVQWESIDATKAKGTIHYGNQSASAIFHIQPNGAVESITAQRYREDQGQFDLCPWLINGFEYQTLAGFQIPYQANVQWQLPEALQSYYQFTIDQYFPNPHLL